MPSRVVSFDTTEGTWMNIDVSPDGETLIFDLLGDIYRLPIEGGEAVSLTTGRAWDQAPRFSPDGVHVHFVSDREGYKNIWRLTLDDQSLHQITRSASDIVGGPNWSQDGSHLLAGLTDPETRHTEFILQAIDPNTGNMTPIDAPTGPWVDMETFESFRPSIKIFSAAESANGDVFFSQAHLDEELGRIDVRMFKFDRYTRTRTAISPANATHSDYKPQLSHDGNLLAYFRQYNDRRTEIRILNRTTRQDEALVALKNADDATYSYWDDSRPNYAFTPDDRQLIFWHGGKIHRLDVADGSSEIIPFRVTIEREVWERVQPTEQLIDEAGEAKIVRWPSMSRDGRMMAFAAIGYIWVMDLQTGTVRRLTRTNDFEYMPAISPDGRSVAYIRFVKGEDGNWPGHLMVTDVEDGTPHTLLAAPNETYLLPEWSPDSTKIALIREVVGESRLDGAFGWTPVASGDFHEVASAPVSSEWLSWFIYARSVGFDKGGCHLLFSFPRPGTGVILAMANLDDDVIPKTLAIGTSEVAGITPAPDLDNLALTRRDGTVWIVPFVVGEEQFVSTLEPDAHRVSDGGGYYVEWNRPTQMTFGFAQNVYRYRLNAGKLEFLRVKIAFPKFKAERSIAFKGARLITMSSGVGAGPVIESGTLIVDGARISMIGPVSDVVIPADSLVVDTSGKTIMPGLLDVHYHGVGGESLSAFALPNANFSDQSAIAYGITTAWEPSGDVNDGVPATVDLQVAGRIAGPRWSYSAMGGIGYPYDQLTNYAAALGAVNQHYELGVTVLKEYLTPTRQQRQWLSTAAYETGLGIVSHIQDFDGLMTRIVDGYTGGDHPYVPMPFYKDVLELLRQTGYIWTPNVAITPGTVGREQRKKDYFCYAVLAWQNRTNSRRREAQPICPSDQSRPTVPYDIQRFSRVAKQATSAASIGVHIGVSAHSLPGFLLHREMWFLRKGGMPIEDVLRAVTIGNAEKLGLQEEIGSLEPGKIADLLVLDENPLNNILNTLSLKYTVQGGVVYDSATGQVVDLMSMREAAVHQDE